MKLKIRFFLDLYRINNRIIIACNHFSFQGREIILTGKAYPILNNKLFYYDYVKKN